MDEINVRRWAKTLRIFQPSIVGDVSTTSKINHNEKLTEKIRYFSDDFNRSMSEKNLDTVSDSGTYIIDDEKINDSFKRYTRSDKHRHGTFDIHGLLSSNSHDIHRPIVDSNMLGENLSMSSSTSTSSLLSLNDEQVKISVRSQCSPTPTKQIKPAEAFIISPILHPKSTQKSKSVCSHFQTLQISVHDQPTTTLTKPFPIRQSHSISKPSKSTSIYSHHQTNRAVELRRARAQAKINQLTQRTKKQQQQVSKPSSMINSFSQNSKRKADDLFTTRTISLPQPTEELLNHGQRLAIKLIQLSSGILEKLKPNESLTVHELQQLVEQLQIINHTLTNIDAALTGSNSSVHIP